MADNLGDFWFVATERQSRKTVLLDIRPHDETTDEYLKKVCQKMSQAAKGFHEVRPERGPAPSWTSWNVASWSKESIQGREKYAAWNGDVLAGYLWVRDGFVSPHTGNNILYIETMAATPTNLETAVWDPCLKHVGLALLGYATFQSQRRGYNGVFGLHAADDVAEGFYRHVDQQIGSVFRPDRTGVKGVDPRAQQNESKLYFETTDNGGLAILEGFRHG